MVVDGRCEVLTPDDDRLGLSMALLGLQVGFLLLEEKNAFDEFNAHT